MLKCFSPKGALFPVGLRDIRWCDPSAQALAPHVHVAGRLYYPAAAPPALTTLARLRTLPARVCSTCFWFPHRLYAKGLAHFLFFAARNAMTWRLRAMRACVELLLWATGSVCRLDAAYNAPLAAPLATPPSAAPRAFPLVLFSHGLAGTGTAYSSVCMQLASQGFVVLALEHADGTASAVRLAVPRTAPPPWEEWMLYAGMGDAQAQVQKTRWRVQELRTALRIVAALNEGKAVDNLWVSGCSSSSSGRSSAAACTSAPEQWLKGRVDMSRVAAAGHSYGGATAALAASEHPEFHAAVALDPWWGPLPPDCSMLQGAWLTPSPILIMGSHDWNTPNAATGRLACDGPKQEAVLAAAASGRGGEEGGQGGAAAPRGGPGALLLVPRGSNHHSFADAVLYFGRAMAPVLSLFNVKLGADPARTMDVICTSTLLFLQSTLRMGTATSNGAACSSPLPLSHAHTAAYKQALKDDDLAITRISCAGECP